MRTADRGCVYEAVTGAELIASSPTWTCNFFRRQLRPTTSKGCSQPAKICSNDNVGVHSRRTAAVANGL